MSLSTHKYLKTVRDKSIAELRDLVGELKGKQFTQRFERVTGKLENYREVPKTKRHLAVVLTLLQEKQDAAAAGKGGKN